MLPYGRLYWETNNFCSLIVIGVSFEKICKSMFSSGGGKGPRENEGLNINFSLYANLWGHFHVGVYARK